MSRFRFFRLFLRDSSKLSIFYYKDSYKSKEYYRMRKYYNSKEAAEYLGMQLSTLYKYTMNDAIPHYKLGNRVLFILDELDRWMKLGK